MKMTYILSDIPDVAFKVLEDLSNKTLLLYGEMGVGKTTLVKELAKKLGVKNLLNSPTYSIINEYELEDEDDKLYHFDFYRLESEDEAIDIGVEDYLYSGHWNIIEWPDKIESLLPEDKTKIQLTKNRDGSRTINVAPMN